MTQLPALYVDPSSIVDPATVPGLRYNRTTWWYEAPQGAAPLSAVWQAADVACTG